MNYLIENYILSIVREVLNNDNKNGVMIIILIVILIFLIIYILNKNIKN